MTRRTRLAATAAAATLVLCATSAASAATTVTPNAKAGTTRTPSAAPNCGFTKAVPADRFKGIPVFDATEAAKPYHATLRTTQGAITFQALTAAAPCTTFSFRFLAEHDYFNRTHCHRLTTQGIFVLQCGDPTGTGSGGPGYSFNDENLTGATYPAGTVAMANAGPNTNGSQFFFVWKDTKLPAAYTPFGTVTGGLDVLQKIAAAGEDDQNGAGDGFPTLPVDIKSVKISDR
ncbi:peptidylprolyl isomerase [Kitasatospora sp. GAS204B]|uniref:peptidylprolyl isomerase n=1 Tax=unclassified Kitasatospora TaxID=2633591 RepID=UPI0024764CE2|nr:peptidylprolyl isomerase [Kitasatospora sp. GAS204B]MDH6118086.1 peptidyl-prolyl cis-trans isomerase B (cyclophilin B) [Kitasatospora sp. GAS204B]